MHTPLIDGDPRPSLRTGATAVTKTLELLRVLARVGANLPESSEHGDSGLLSPRKFSFQFAGFSSARSQALFGSASGSRLQHQWLVKID